MMKIRAIRCGCCCLTLGATMLVASCGGSSSSNSGGMAIAPIAAMTTNQDTTAVVPLQVTDGSTATSSMTVAATAADGNLVVPQGISVQNNGSGLNLLITPLEDTAGSTTINVTVTDPNGATAQTSFMLTVNAVNVSFTTLATTVLGVAEDADPVTVNGFMVTQDADDATQFTSMIPTS